MCLYRTLVAAFVAASFVASPAAADPPRDAERAFRATTEGRLMPLQKVRRQVQPMVGRDADYLGPELIGSTYRLKFIQKDGRVIWVDVDARTGRVKGKR